MLFEKFIPDGSFEGFFERNRGNEAGLASDWCFEQGIRAEFLYPDWAYGELPAGDFRGKVEDATSQITQYKAGANRSYLHSFSDYIYNGKEFQLFGGLFLRFCIWTLYPGPIAFKDLIRIQVFQDFLRQ